MGEDGGGRHSRLKIAVVESQKNDTAFQTQYL